MKKTLMIAAAATGLTLGSAAFAQDRMHGGGDMTRANVETRTAERFARMDANGDGVLNAEDREAHMRQMFEAADANGDGQMSFEEMQAHHQQRHGQRHEGHGEAGEQGHGDGHRMGRMGRRGHGGGMRAMMMSRADTDNDGSISQAEFTAAALARFDRVDANGDGTLTAEERQAHWQERRGNRQERRQQRMNRQ